MAVEKEMFCKDVLAHVLKTEFSARSFSLDGYDEDTVCLKQIGDLWEVYIGTRGQKIERMEYDNIISACLGVIERLTPHNESLRSKLNKMFADEVLPAKPIKKSA